MQCQQKDCKNDSDWIQLTIDGEMHYCSDCMAALGGTYRDVPKIEHDPETMNTKVS